MRHAWALAALSLGLVGASAWAADDPQVGRWKLDVGHSKYVSAKAPKSGEAVVTSYGDGVSLNVESVTAKGEKAHIAYAAHYDGKPMPRTESGAGATTGLMVTLKRAGPRTIERKVFYQGKEAGTERWTISADGKKRTVVQSGVDMHGKKIDNHQVYVRE